MYVDDEPYNLQREMCLQLDPEDDDIPAHCEPWFAQAGIPLEGYDAMPARLSRRVEAVRGKLPSVGDLRRARKAVKALYSALRNWMKVEAIRRGLGSPQRRALVPRSRLRNVLNIINELRDAGAIKVFGQKRKNLAGYGYLEGYGDPITLTTLAAIAILSLVVIASAAAVAIIISKIPAIMAEHRASKDALRVAEQLERNTAVEVAQAAEVGAERAREMASARAADQLAYRTSPLPEMPEVEPAGGGSGFTLGGVTIPFWVPLAVGGVGLAVVLVATKK